MKKIYLFCFVCLLCLTAGQVSAQSFHSMQVTKYDTTSNGYYFFCPYTFSGYPNFPLGTQRHMILDSKGEVVYYKDMTNYFAGNFQLQDNGLISYGWNHMFIIMDSTFSIIDTVKPRPGVMFDVHELKILPNGNYLLFGEEDVIRDLSGYNMFLGNHSPGKTNARVRAGIVEELDSARNVVFEWHAINHFAFDDVDEFFVYDTTLVDWTHYNAIEVDTDGNLLISSRHFNEITKISRTDSSVIWRMGGKHNMFTFINDTIGFLGQHDIRRLPNGHVTLFDNGRNDSIVHPASAKEYVLDETAMTATLVWSYTEDDTVGADSQGNVQRLANGNTLISWGDFRQRNFVFNVIDSVGNKAMEISFPDTLVTYRTFNYPTLPWTLPQPVISCTETSGQATLDAGSGHSGYYWSDGSTTQTISVNDTGTYFAYVQIGSGGYIRSHDFVISDVSQLCGTTTGIKENSGSDSFTLFPNPADDKVSVHFNGLSREEQHMELFDIRGKKLGDFLILPGSRHKEIDLSSYSPGIYFLRAGNTNRRIIKN